MVQTFHMQPFFRQAPLTVDTTHTQQKYFEEDDGSILDESILDNSAIDSGLEMSPPMVDSRRESFAVGSSLFSPKQEDWPQAVDMQSVPSNNPFDPHSNNPFMRVDQQPTSFGPQAGQWSMSSSGTATPMHHQFDSLPGEFETNTSIFHRHSMQGPAPFNSPATQVSMFGSMGGPSVTSPQQKEVWMAQSQAMSKSTSQTHPGSPSVGSHNELSRGDGIRWWDLGNGHITSSVC